MLTKCMQTHLVSKHHTPGRSSTVPVFTQRNLMPPLLGTISTVCCLQRKLYFYSSLLHWAFCLIQEELSSSPTLFGAVCSWASATIHHRRLSLWLTLTVQLPSEQWTAWFKPALLWRITYWIRPSANTLSKKSPYGYMQRLCLWTHQTMYIIMSIYLKHTFGWLFSS